MKPKRLIRHLYIPYLTFFFVVGLCLTTFVFSGFKRFYYEQAASNLKDNILLIEVQILDYFETGRSSMLNTLLKKTNSLIPTRFTFMERSGLVIADSESPLSELGNHKNRPEMKEAILKGWGGAQRHSDTLQTTMLYSAKAIYYKEKPIGVIRASLSIESLEDALRNIQKKGGALGLVVLLFSALGIFVISRRISKPIHDLTKGAKAFAKGQLNYEIKTSTILEYTHLTLALNHMSKELKDRIKTITKQAHEKNAILLNMREGIITVNKHGAITSMNQSAKKYMGIHEAQIIGKHFETVIHHPGILDITKQVHLSQQVVEKELHFNTPKDLVIRVHGVCLQGGVKKRRKHTGVLLVLHDITRIKKLEYMRKSFVENVSHELKTPITLIKGFLETLLKGAIDEPKEAKEFLGIIQTHANRLEAIIEDLLSLSRIEQESDTDAVEKESTLLNAIIEKAIESCKEKAYRKKILLQFKSHKNSFAHVNVSLIEQAIINLVDNGIKHSPSDSKIKITLTQTKLEHLISVIDEGCGIPEKHLPHLFERFYRVDKARSRKLGGTGLGLAIVKHIAQAHSGGIAVQSEEGKGSQFTIHFPI